VDPVTHLLTGWPLARTGMAGDSRHATVALLVSSLLVDIDVLHLAAGAESYARHGGAWSHSIIGSGLLGAATAVAFWAWAAKKKQEVPLLRLGMGCMVAAWVHMTMDWATPVGIRLLYPFRNKLFALDWFPMTDLLLLVLFTVTLFLPWLFSLIQEEIGARRKDRPPRWGAWVALGGLLLLVGARAMNHQDALAELDSQRYQGSRAERTGVFPTAANPYRWVGLADTGNSLAQMDIDLLRGRVERTGAWFKPQAHPALEAAERTGTMETFRLRARFPLAGVTRTSKGWRVELQDLSCSGGASLCPRLEAGVEMNSEFFVTAEWLRWGSFGRAAR